MTETAHIFTPADESLKAKASAWKKVAASYNNLKKSQAKMNAKPQDKAWANRIGTEQEVADASKIIEHSLSKAAASFNQEALKQAQQDNLLSSEDVKNIVITQRKVQAQQRSNTQNKDQSRSR